MADGLVKRFKDAGQQPPRVLYTDCECCGDNNGSKYNHLFEAWPNLIVCLDIYHYMRRFDDSAILEEEIEDPLDSITSRDHEETQQEEVNAEVCLKEFTLHYPKVCSFSL